LPRFRTAAADSEPFLDDLQVAGQENPGAEWGAAATSGIPVAEIAEANYVCGVGALDWIVHRIVL
jgi:hypothetical protein